jgi:hypothetical protein
MAFNYPTESEIVDPRKGLPAATVELLEPCFSEGQWRFREWQNDPDRRESAAIEILAGVAVGVFDRLAQEMLQKHADDFDAFRAAIGPDGGAAELGMKYAHFIYKDVTRGRMLFLWHKPISHQIFDAIAKFENEWWQNQRAQSAAGEPAQPRARRDVVAVATRRKAVVEPILDAKGWSILRWANEADVDYNTASDFLNGLTDPHRPTRVRLAKALSVPVSELPK